MVHETVAAAAVVPGMVVVAQAAVGAREGRGRVGREWGG